MSTDRDTDEAANTFVRGPGRRRRRTADPVYDAYALNGAINRHCGNCGAVPRAYCTHPDGTPRKIPCSQRLSERKTP